MCLGRLGMQSSRQLPSTHTPRTASASGCPRCLETTTRAGLTWCPGTVAKGVATAPVSSTAAGLRCVMSSLRGSVVKGEDTSPSCSAAAPTRGASLASPTGPLAKAEAEEVRSTGCGVGGGTLAHAAEGAVGALLVAPCMMATEWSSTAATTISAVSCSSSAETLEACGARPWLSTTTAVLCSLGLGHADGFDS